MKNWSNKSLVGVIFGLTALIVIGASAPQIFNRIKVNDGILCNNFYNADGSFAFYSSDVGTITGKADKVSGATDGNFAGLDASGNLTDSGWTWSSFFSFFVANQESIPDQPAYTLGNLVQIEKFEEGNVFYLQDTGKKISDLALAASVANAAKWDQAYSDTTNINAVNGIVKSDGAGNYSAVADNSANWDSAYTETSAMQAAAQGTIYYSTGSDIAYLTPGTSGQVLKTNGAGANPSWTAAGAIGGATGSTDNALIRADGTGGATIQGSSATMDDSGALNVPTGQSYKINNTIALWNPLAAYNIVLGAGGASLAHGAGDTGYYNTVGGYGSGAAMTSGYNNSGWGANVLASCTTGNRNSGWGRYALGSLTEGIHNNALGYACLYYCTTGNYNTASGNNALYNCTGSNNTAIGYQAGDTITTGSNNTVIGCEADVSAAGATNETVIGYQAVGMGNSTMSFGNASIVANYLRAQIAMATYQEADTAVINSIFVDDDDYKLKHKNNAGTVIDLTSTSGFASSDITGQSEKTTLVDNDLFVISDSEASGALKKVKKSNLGTGGGSGDVTGPSSSVDNQATRFDGITGKLLQASSLYIDDDGGIRMPENMSTPATPASGTLKLYAQGSQFYSMDDGGDKKILGGEWSLVKRVEIVASGARDHGKTDQIDGAQTTVTFSGLDGNTDRRYKIVGRFPANASEYFIGLRINDKTSAYITTLGLHISGTTTSSSFTSSPGSDQVLAFRNIEANAYTFGDVELDAKTGIDRMLKGNSMVKASAGIWAVSMSGYINDSSNNITSINLRSLNSSFAELSGGIGVGSCIELYKLAE